MHPKFWIIIKSQYKNGKDLFIENKDLYVAVCYNENVLAIYERIDNFSKETFYLHVQELCHELDIPTPVILKYHIENYVNFNVCHFLKRDFVESINFDKLVIEEASIK